jgi:hypothetical protein
MSREDVEYFRDEFYDRMVRDIDREIAWQRTNPNALAGNVLCALGLVVYTEVLGRVAIQQLEGRQPGNRCSMLAIGRLTPDQSHTNTMSEEPRGTASDGRGSRDDREPLDSQP